MLFWILKFTALTKAVSRAREAVKFGLEDIYKKKTRPKSLSNSEYFHVAALVDSTSIPICRPTGKHLEVKPYWDHKHSMYALKKQVVVMAQNLIWLCSQRNILLVPNLISKYLENLIRIFRTTLRRQIERN